MSEAETPPFGEESPAKKPRGPGAKGSPEAMAWAQKMADARKRAKEKREGAGSPARSGAVSGSKPAPSRVGTVAEVQADLRQGLDKLGALLIVPAPIPGTYVVNTAEELSDVVGRMAERNPKLLVALSGSSNLMDYVALGAWGLGLAVATGVQMGRVTADAPIARKMGITEIVVDLEAAGVIQVNHGPTPLIEESSPTAGFGAAEVFEAFVDPSPIGIPDPGDVART